MKLNPPYNLARNTKTEYEAFREVSNTAFLRKLPLQFSKQFFEQKPEVDPAIQRSPFLYFPFLSNQNCIKKVLDVDFFEPQEEVDPKRRKGIQEQLTVGPYIPRLVYSFLC